MKRLVLTVILAVCLSASFSFADKGGHMMEHMAGSPGYGGSEKSGYPLYGMMGPGMMGYGGCGMHGMGPGMMGPGMMGYGGCGMMGPGMTGYGGYGMMGHHQMMHGMGPGMMRGYDTKEYEKFMNDTKDLRRKLHNMKFEYFEAVRNPEAKREDLSKLEKEMWDIQKQIYDKWQK